MYANLQTFTEGTAEQVRRQLDALPASERAWRSSQGRCFLHHAVVEQRADLVPVIHELAGGTGSADAYSLTPLALALATHASACAEALQALDAPRASQLNEVRPLALDQTACALRSTLDAALQ